MKSVTVTVGEEKLFFTRGKAIAVLADAGKPIPSECIISFGDPADLLRVLTPARIALISTLKSGSSSITEISNRLHRDRASVSKDVEKLHACGLLQVVQKVLPGHGRQKEVSLTASRMQLQAMLA